MLLLTSVSPDSADFSHLNPVPPQVPWRQLIARFSRLVRKPGSQALDVIMYQERPNGQSVNRPCDEEHFVSDQGEQGSWTRRPYILNRCSPARV